MAAPRVFVSSTYYDLKYVRDELREFIVGLGYSAVMHDKGNVTYTQDKSLESSCFEELSNCEIVVCIIGSKFGTESESGYTSITMEEIKRAIKEQKKVYIFIQKNVYDENQTYIKNKDKIEFEPAHADSIKIHEFIAELKENVRSNLISPFDNVSDIKETLRQQFAGMFQRLLMQEQTLTEQKTYNDLKEVSEEIKGVVGIFKQTNDEYSNMLSQSFLAPNWLTIILLEKINLSGVRLFLQDKIVLIDFLQALGFCYNDEEDEYSFSRKVDEAIQTLKISEDAFNNKGQLIMIRNRARAESLLHFEESTLSSDDFAILDDSEDLPF